MKARTAVATQEPGEDRRRLLQIIRGLLEKARGLR